MKKTKILVPALGILALGMAASVTGTVAWFTQNAIATASGMAVYTKVPSSLYIAKDFVKSNASGSLTQDSISYTDDAVQLDPTHMSFESASKTLTAQIPDEEHWTADPDQTSAGHAGAWSSTLGGTLVGGATDGLAGVTNTGFSAYAYYVKQSIVRKANEESTQTYKLLADITIKNIDNTKLHEVEAFQTLRVGFMSTVNNGAAWDFKNPQAAWTAATQENSVRNSGSATQQVPTGTSGEQSATYRTDFEAVSVCTDNSVVNLVVVVWLEGEDTRCYALNFQEKYNWTIDISYHTMDL